MNLTCNNCGIIFQRTRHRKFCSHSCAGKFIWRNSTTHPFVRSKTAAKCHPDRPLTAKGLCKQCYYKKYKQIPHIKQAYAVKSRKTTLNRLFGISPEQWNKMYDIQNGICVICLHPITRINSKNGKRSASVDHDHKTKRVRGLLCHSCNRWKVGTNTVETAKRIL